MKAVDALITYLENDETVLAYKRIEKKVLETAAYKALYQTVLDKQKAMVQAREKNASNLDALKQHYEAALSELEKIPIVHHYLLLQSEVNTKLQMITDLIETALNKPFDNR